jgi:hypothetical protein
MICHPRRAVFDFLPYLNANMLGKHSIDRHALRYGAGGHSSAKPASDRRVIDLQENVSQGNARQQGEDRNYSSVGSEPAVSFGRMHEKP